MYADRIRAWDGVAPEQPDVRLRVDAASLGRRVVYFNLLPPWDQPAEVTPALTSAADETPWAFVVRFSVPAGVDRRRRGRVAQRPLGPW